MRTLKDLTHNEEYKAKLKIVTGKYICEDHFIVVPVDDWTVQITESDVKQLFRTDFSSCEPMSQFFMEYMAEKGVSMETLRTYTSENGILGKDFTHDKVFFRLYHSHLPQNMERDDAGRKWIDFDTQLRLHPGFIEDENGYGIWATFGDAKKLRSLLRDTMRYGDSIAILQLFPHECYRLHKEKQELNGDRYQVEFHGPLDEPDTWKYLRNYFDIHDLVEYDSSFWKWKDIVEMISR